MTMKKAKIFCAACLAWIAAGTTATAQGVPAEECAGAPASPEPQIVRLVPTKSEPFASRESAAAFFDTDVPAQTLADLLWAADGINRGNGKRTAPTALNKQEIGIWVFRADGVFSTKLGENEIELTRVSAKDLRPLIVSTQPNFGNAPVMLLLVADLEKFSMMPPDRALVAASIDAGAVMQNILLFCAQKGLGARPRMQMDTDALAAELAFPPTLRPLLNVIVGVQ